MRHLLVAPPFADPTQPYLSLPTLKGSLRARGLDARVVDLNVEAAHWLLAPRRVEALARELRSRSRELAARHRGALDALLEADPTPIDVFQDRERFFDEPLYERSRRLVESLFDALGDASDGFRFGFNRAEPAEGPWSFERLERYPAASPLADFYDELLRGEHGLSDAFAEPEELALVGLSIAFPSQLAEAFHLARALREHAPRALFVLGGPCAHQVLVHMDPARRARFLGPFDAAGLFEGEETLARLVPLSDELLDERDAERRVALLREVPNLLARDPANASCVEGPRHTLDLREAAPPDYDDLDLDRYLAPSRTLLYAPTRGCYWGKCSFCYYGLAESATASYREVPPERAAAQLLRLGQRHGLRDVYLSCDVLSPSYAVRLAQALKDRRSRLRWHCDLKIERFFTPERCELLREGGLRAAAFGIESGSDRVLELMRKGCDRETMTRVNRAFHEAGIATQWMAFTDHPTESAAEALATVRWIGEESDAIGLFHVGRFGLEPGADVALDPKRYGVAEVRRAEGDDLGLTLSYREQRPGRREGAMGAVEGELDELASARVLRPYPWAGAISTHHSFLYFVERGPNAFRRYASAR